METKLERILLNLVRDANRRWDMFSPGETLIVGVSGGKDSLSCLRLLSLLGLKLIAVHIGFSAESRPEIEKYCSYYADYKYIRAPQINGHKKAGNPCYACSRQRKRLLLEQAEACNCRRIVMAHHKDDAVETLLLNMIYSREISTMTPVQALFSGDYHIIRPMYLIPEPMIVTYAREQRLPVTPRSCEFEDQTKRIFIKNLLKEIGNGSPGIDVVDNIFSSILNIKGDFLPS
ncbi:MAG: hypothetical protein JXR21_04130 [Candidatus Marinimicrobia bacterium]|nr:hypothetical protein [Candidatus Neomarinimicrobiota bacterium]